MNITATFDAAALESSLAVNINEVVPRVQAAMAEQTRDIVMSNFGATGVDRPLPWEPLSNHAPYFYAQKVGRPFATLYVTGAMAGAVRTTNDPEASSVSLSDADCSYASKHHYGTDGMPIRRVFPINLDGSITQYTMDAVISAAAQELQEALS